MFYVSEFCRICLQLQKPLVDIAKKETESETLMNKLKICVSEVEWLASENIFMCKTCLDKLNTAFEFKKQCLQSAQVWENYLSQLISKEDAEDGKKKSGKLSKEEDESQKPAAYIHIKSGQQLYPQLQKIFLTASNTTNLQNTPFPNIFLNLVPSTAVKYPTATNVTFLNKQNSTPNAAEPPIKDANQNMFLNISSTYHKLVPIITPTQDAKVNLINTSSSLVPSTTREVNISQILTESKTEELSVDVDPMCFDYSADDEANPICDDISKDWEDLISTNKIGPDFVKKTDPIFHVPEITRKQKEANCNLHEKMMEFLNIDHFMATKSEKECSNDSTPKSLMCEQCGQTCDTLKALRNHIKQFHLGKFPYKCLHCSSVYALRSQYELHMQKHTMTENFCKDTITLEDLSVQNESALFPQSVSLSPQSSTMPYDTSKTRFDVSESHDDETGDFKCESCPRSFNSSHGLSRHKVRKHNQSARKKYFVKGMKNAKCDICNREFSTQSYLQLHIKLHYRKNDYRLKVFNKSKYEQEQEKKEETPAVEMEQNEIEPVTEIEAVEEVTPPVSTLAEELPVSDEEKCKQESLKIKINLKHLKQSPLETNNENNDNLEETSNTVVENETSVNGVVESPKEKDEEATNDDSASDLMDYEGSGELSSNTDISEETDSLKDEGSQEGCCSPLKFPIVDGKAQCSLCCKLFSRKHDLKRHINNIHLKAIQFVCHLCNSQFYEAFHLTRHLRQHNSFIRCTACMKDFSVLRDLKLHIASAHDNNAPSQCGTCGSIFQKIKHLRDHMHVHDKIIVYKCHICNEEYKESRELSKHLVKHSGMYSCNTCHMTFTAEYELNNHFKCHTKAGTCEDDRKYECTMCHNKYKRRRYLSLHMNSRHAVDVINRIDSEGEESS